MYCPKCGGVAADEQKFCKLCGSNLQIVSEALQGASLGTDLDALRRNLKDLGRNIAGEIKLANGPRVYGMTLGNRRRTNRNLSERREKIRKLRFTRGYNLQRGIYKLISGAATSGALYLLFNANLSTEITRTVQEIVANSGNGNLSLVGMPLLLRSLWLLGLIPMGKGIAYLINGAFFSKPTEQFLKEIESKAPAAISAVSPETTSLNETPPMAVPRVPSSVAEHTTFHLNSDL